MSTTRLPPSGPSLRPPQEKGTGRAFLLALLFHLLLILLIAFGVHWRSHPPEAVEAELWSVTPQVAAPRPTAPLVEKQPKPQPAPEPPPPPRVAPAPKPQPQQPSQADIVLKQEREQAALEKKKLEQEQQRLARLRAEEAARRKAEQQKLAEEKAQRLAEEKAKKLAEQKKLEAEREARLQEQQRLLAQQKKEAELKKREQQEAQLAASARADYMKQLMAQAGTGAATSAGTAARSAGPSGAYAGRIAALIKQNVIYPQIDQISGDPKVVITVRLDPNSGEVMGATITRSSGVPSWDQAVLQAIERVGRFPPDERGNWYTPMEIKAGPHDNG